MITASPTPQFQPQMQPAPPPPQHNADPLNYQAPPAYSWKTDEFKTSSEARNTTQITAPSYRGPQPLSPPMTAPVGFHQPMHLAQPYRCPYCSSQYLPTVIRKISTGGWVTFALLLVFFFPLFWIGLLMKEDQRYCPSCNSRVG